MRRLFLAGLSLVLVAGACGGDPADISNIPELAATTPDEIEILLAESDQPVVLNVWASWCIPCRSEAPLLDRAAAAFSGRVRIVGVNVRDSQSGARQFIAEFFPDAPIEHRFDRNGDVPPALGGSGAVPLTFFFAPGGELVRLHAGVLDERTLAIEIDEILARGSSS
jgi:cytochrome c biogenesis protein CcmG/thiol:disulfide interchange protein DsbE